MIVAEQNGDKTARRESTNQQPSSQGMAFIPVDLWRELPKRGRSRLMVTFISS